MTVVVVEGFDAYPAGVTAAGGLSSAWTLNATTEISLVAGRFGGLALERTGSGSSARTLTRFLPAAVATLSAGFAYKADAPVPAAAAALFEARSASGIQFLIGVNTAGQLIACRAAIGTVLATSSAAPDWLNWQYIELEAVIHDSTGELRVYVNGSQVISVSGVDTKGQSEATADRFNFQLAQMGASAWTGTKLDDCYVTDAAARLGDVRVITLRPDADGATTDFTPLGGGTNAAEVDETQSDGDTSYNEADAAGAIDLYGCGALGVTPGTIHAVQVSVCARKTDAGTREARTKLLSNATTVNGDTTALGSSYGWLRDVVELDPDTAAAWTEAGVNAAFAGLEIVT